MDMSSGHIEGTGFEIIDRRFADCFFPHEKIERVWTGGRWCEGPAWFPAHRTLVWSDIPNDRMMRWDEQNAQVGVFRQSSSYANGNTVDLQGRLLTCEHLNRRVVRTEHDGQHTVVASHWQGKRLNSPNDLVVHSDGGIWFTDPDYGILSDYEGQRSPSEIGVCNVYRVDPHTGAVDIVANDFTKPNGIAFSPDEKILYVADTGASHIIDGPKHIRRLEVTADGRRLGKSDIFTECSDGLVLQMVYMSSSKVVI
jgi:gluconolactonase